jgi:hypothetical protein
MKIRTFILTAGLIGLSTSAFAQGAPGSTGGASGSIGGTQAGTTTAAGGSNGNASTPAPAGRPETNGSMMAPEASRSAPGGTTQVPGRSQ